MISLLYPKLAKDNIKRNRKVYLPYMVTSSLSVTMYYIFYSISIHQEVEKNSSMMLEMLSMGSVLLGIFSLIFILYINSFLIKRRKKELGLYGVLGLGKREIGQVLFFEHLYTSCISLVAGIVFGVLLGKLCFVGLLRLLELPLKIGFPVMPDAILRCLLVYGVIFFLAFLYHLVQVQRANPILLLQGGEVGEKEPKTKWIMTLVGVVSLGLGYTIAVTTQMSVKTLAMFFLAVFLVMLGTYGLFTAGSIAFLKALRKNKRFYYQINHFTAVSGMLYRMKQNAVGLSNICILSVMVLLVFSTTVSLYAGLDDIVNTRYPREVETMAFLNPKETWGKKEYAELRQQVSRILEEEAKKGGYTITNPTEYLEVSKGVSQQGNRFLGFGERDVYLTMMNLEDYNKNEGKQEQLASGEVLLYTNSQEKQHTEIFLGDRKYQVKKYVDHLSSPMMGVGISSKAYLLVVPDIFDMGEQQESYRPVLSFRFDLSGTDKDQIAYQNGVSKGLEELKEENIYGYIDTKASGKQDILQIYGIFLFIGIFLGGLFLVATILIIYYKQISEGYEDKQRFAVMQKVGLSKKEIKKTIRTQVLLVFFLPLIFTVMHMAFAFPMLTKILAMLQLTNVKLFFFTTLSMIFLFFLVYIVVFLLTAKSYYTIVTQVE